MELVIKEQRLTEIKMEIPRTLSKTINKEKINIIIEEKKDIEKKVE